MNYLLILSMQCNVIVKSDYIDRLIPNLLILRPAEKEKHLY